MDVSWCTTFLEHGVCTRRRLTIDNYRSTLARVCADFRSQVSRSFTGKYRDTSQKIETLRTLKVRSEVLPYAWDHTVLPATQHR